MGSSKSNNSTPVVFIDTNFGTHLAVPVSINTTVKEFKSGLEKMHLNRFPELGNIRVNALMVKQKSHCYHLSESTLLKYFFRGSNGTCFLQTDVVPWSITDQLESFESDGTTIHNHNSTEEVVIHSVGAGGLSMDASEKKVNCKKKKRKLQRFPYIRPAILMLPAAVYLSKRKKRRRNIKKMYKTGGLGQGPVQQRVIENKNPGNVASRAEVDQCKMWDTNMMAEADSGTFSESVSVSGIIKKYFSDYDEVASSPGFPFTTVPNRQKERLSSRACCRYLNDQSTIMSPVKPCIAPQVSCQNYKKPEVGKRLLRASDILGLTPSNRMPSISLCKSGDRKSPLHKTATVVRNLVFEISEESD